MKCPFKKKVTITKGIKKAYCYPYDKIENYFGECSKQNCMAYDKETERCLKIK